MALRSLHQCSVAGCTNKTRLVGRCEKHAKEKATYDQHRPNSYQRGYDKRWAAFRLAFLQEHPLCEDCMAKSRIEPAAEVHHIEKVRDSRARMYDEANCMALCASCHSRRSARGE
jgi:5-methylcytosine-specific restriction enzyme A